MADLVHRYIPGSADFTLLALHEQGATEDDLLPIARAVAPGAAVLSPRLNDETTPSVIAAWAAERLPGVRLCAFGYASGADFAAALLLEYPDLLTAAVLLRPGNLARPAVLPSLEGKAVLVVAGTNDNVHPPDSAVAVARLLADAGTAIDFSEHDADHGLTPQDFALTQRWLAGIFSGRKETL